MFYVADGSLQRLKHEIGIQACIAGAGHDRTQKDRFEIAAVIGKVTVGLTECGDNLRHLKTEEAVFIGQGRAMTARKSLFGVDM